MSHWQRFLLVVIGVPAGLILVFTVGEILDRTLRRWISDPPPGWMQLATAASVVAALLFVAWKLSE